MPKDTVRTTVVLPTETAEQLKRLVPTRERSQFIAEAIEQQLMRIVYRQGRELSFGAWKDEDYPHLQTGEDLRRYIADLRDESQWRRATDTQEEA